MRIALIGTGKTGGAFLELAKVGHEVISFSSRTPCTLAEVSRADAVVVFVPAAGLADLSTLLIESRRPVVCGTTGFDFSSLTDLAAPWIVASNFSIGMNATFLIARLLGRLQNLSAATYHVHEVHHVMKKDAPSGTALYLKSLLPAETEITAERIGDARGTHRLQVDLPGESVVLQHDAHDRSVFAAGALYAAEKMLPNLNPGLHRFESLMEQLLRKELFHA